jgi:hypothetical protein
MEKESEMAEVIANKIKFDQDYEKITPQKEKNSA